VEKNKYYIIVCIFAVALAVYVLCSGGATFHDILNRVDGITANNVGAGKAVDSVKQDVGDVGNELGAVSGRVGEYAKSAHDIAGEIKDSREIAKRSLELNRRAKQILEDIEQRNKEPAATGKDKPG
jgi:methyl-accepting chemotaxis protein